MISRSGIGGFYGHHCANPHGIERAHGVEAISRRAKLPCCGKRNRMLPIWPPRLIPSGSRRQRSRRRRCYQIRHCGRAFCHCARASRRQPFRQGLKIIEVDFDALDQYQPEISALAPNALICALGATIRKAGSKDTFARVDRDYVAAFAALGRAAGASHFGLVSAVGADARSRPIGEELLIPFVLELI